MKSLSFTGRQALEHCLEADLFTLIQNLFGHSSHTVQCQIIDKHCIVVLISGIRTLPENLLLQQGNIELARKFRNSLHRILNERIREPIEQVSRRKIIHMDMPYQVSADLLGFVVSVDGVINWPK